MKHFSSLLAGLSIALILTGCAGFTMKKPSGTSVNSSETAASDETPKTLPKEEAQAAIDPNHPNHIQNITIGDIIRIEEPDTQTLYDNSRYDFPITVNSRVEGWIDYFTGRGRSHMERYLSRSTRYIPLMRKILKENGLPEDLVYLALIESGFNLRAKSRARAVGPWQFIKGTGTRYGLRVDGWIDERNDPIRSTEVAAAYLKDLYLMFESWYLAASAYNAGEFKILRAIDTLKTNNFWRIAKSRAIRRETKDYVPKLIAAAIIAKNAERYGFKDVDYLEPMQFEIVNIDFPIHLREIAKLIDEPVEAMEDLNPELRRGMIPPNEENYELRVPVGTRVLVDRALATLKQNFSPKELPQQHLVRRGETLFSIARKYGIYKRDLANANNLSPRAKLTKGTQLIIPKVTAANRYKPKSKWTYGEGYSTHKVRKGESLWSISIKHDVTVQELFAWNDLDRNRIFPGMKLKIRNKEKLKRNTATTQSKTPDPSGFFVHVVQRGESLWEISKAYEVSIHEIKDWNGLRSSRIYPGKRLKIKAKSSSAESAVDSPESGLRALTQNQYAIRMFQ